MKMLHTFRPNYSTKTGLILSKPDLVKHIRYTCEFQSIKFNPNYTMSRQAAFPVQESASSLGQYATFKKKPGLLYCQDLVFQGTGSLLGPFPDPCLKQLCWSVNNHLASNCLSRKTTQWFPGITKTALTEPDKNLNV